MAKVHVHISTLTQAICMYAVIMFYDYIMCLGGKTKEERRKYCKRGSSSGMYDVGVAFLILFITVRFVIQDRLADERVGFLN